MNGDDAGRRGTLAPPVDLVGHFREVGRALLPAALVALIVACAVFGLRTFLTEKEYGASMVAEITPAREIVIGDAFIEQLRAPFEALAIDEDVLEQVLAQVDTGWDVATLRSHIDLTPGPSPELLVFTVTAPTPELARQVARATVTTVAQASFANHSRDVSRQVDQLQASIAAEEARLTELPPDDPTRGEAQQDLARLQEQIATLQFSGGDQLSVLAVPEQSYAPVAPQPVSEALVAGLAALLISAEIFVFWRGHRGNRPNRTWARRISYKYHSYFDPHAVKDGELPPTLEAKAALLQREHRDVILLVGSDTVPLRLDVWVPQQASGHRRTLHSLRLNSPWWQKADLTEVAMGVVVVSTHASERGTAEDALRQLAEFGVPSGLVLQGRKRGRRAQSPPPPTNVPEVPPQHRGVDHDI